MYDEKNNLETRKQKKIRENIPAVVNADITILMMFSTLYLFLYIM